MSRAVFLDRDGTLIEEREYLSRPEGVAPLPGAGPALRSLREAGFKLFVVSNQSGVGRVNERMTEMFAAEGVRFDKIYIAPEAPDQPSRGRKPAPGFLLEARDQFSLDLPASYVIGDKLSDLECGWNAGAGRSILVRTGFGKKVEEANQGRLGAALVVDDLAAAARWILQPT